MYNVLKLILSLYIIAVLNFVIEYIITVHNSLLVYVFITFNFCYKKATAHI